MDASLLILRTGKECLPSPLFKIVLTVIASALRREEEITIVRLEEKKNCVQMTVLINHVNKSM